MQPLPPNLVKNKGDKPEAQTNWLANRLATRSRTTSTGYNPALSLRNRAISQYNLLELQKIIDLAG
jgi:hypothetical protein